MSLPLIGAAIGKAFTAIGSIGAGLQAAISVGSVALSYAQAKGQANAMEQANDEANERARRYMIDDYDSMTRMQQQETAAAGQRVHQNQLEARKAAASAQVASTAGGVSGLSVDALLSDIWGQEASMRDAVVQNLEATGQQLGTERTSIQRNYETSINTRQSPQHPSLFGSVLEAGAGVVGAYKDQWKIRGSGY